MPLELSIRSRLKRWPVSVAALRECSFALAECCLPQCDGEVSICLVSAAEMARINQEFLNHEGPTDVITFDYGDPGGPGSTPGTQRLLSAEIFICPEVADRQGREVGVLWKTEVLRYLIHGFLHLEGYDDLEPAKRVLMKRRENALVKHFLRRFSDCWT